MGEATLPRVDIAVAGGSIAGLCAGNALASAGFDVHVFERSRGRLSSQGAGIVVQPELLGLLQAVDAPKLATTGCSIRRTIDAVSGAVREVKMPQRFTSWEAIYASLRAAFPATRYHSGTTIGHVEPRDGALRIEAGDRMISTSMLIAADGFRSALRTRFAPETLSQYAGYIAWRGVVDERDVPDELAAFFDDFFTFCPAPDGGHALCYLIPGAELDTDRGGRRLNWVWYVPVEEGPTLDAVMTDREGRRRDAAVPQGHVSEGALEGLRSDAERLDPRFAELVKVTPHPFIQSIIDVAPPAMVFGRTCLIGDAAFVVRPHTAAAAAKAAADASTLVRALRGNPNDYDVALGAWERERLQVGRELVNYGVLLGERARSERER